MEDPDEILDPRLRLQMLTVSDRQARANMMRYSAALRIMLMGQRDETPDLRVLIGMGFGMSDATDLKYQMLTRTDGCDRIYVRFDVDDACGPPDGLGVIRLEGNRAVLYGQCRLWAPAGTGRPVVIFGHEGKYGHFTYRPLKTLTRVDSLPAKDLMPGFRRADARLAKLVSSERLLDIGEPIISITLEDFDKH
ncbi:hypothetical protein ACM61V_16650 [Sphingomonas sp. TX0543]|uniref:hypothetical protein n=1 Tax=unclassified Sphingomonas TaxID=196159 RepID=UPI0010F85FC3|nr:hypothetical protein [Sphingomonas sp. 3P27F8]